MNKFFCMQPFIILKYCCCFFEFCLFAHNHDLNECILIKKNNNILNDFNLSLYIYLNKSIILFLL